MRRMWTTLPHSVRAIAYEKLLLAGSYFYGRSLSPRVQRLPFGLYLRKGQPQEAVKYRVEARALGMVEKFTQMPAPMAIDVLETPDASHLLMTQVPGRPIGQLLNTMTDKQVENDVTDIKQYVAELRAIPNEVSKFQICNSEGGGILDWRIPDSQSKKLRIQTETDFNNYLTAMMTDDARRHAAKSHTASHAIVFTHRDLNPRNILARNGKITGIVDWENVGFFPEYWEYTKMHDTVRSLIRWLAGVVDRVFAGYRDELHVENMLSDLSGPF
ncbi:Aminoglycoside phosphotransferase [Penicillium expansum]|uniref:Aminoglycoside phosphotransferase n=1 Tax=Penicillium expansum TaxID=27334 RepID=A0A0A2IHC1_PENEN|nr:Aminoglycoside phosphotransferase [Penicillium expansum]KGO41826.1 Aminoglycoside phosphotransferase [Penicillium expansum]KGO51179.1 Aminoglycoside phosphotransferase [Penicillium expansum]KGO63654.1 Aminoglycoside phosphotransferase [Penicillium expansum]